MPFRPCRSLILTLQHWSDTLNHTHYILTALTLHNISVHYLPPQDLSGQQHRLMELFNSGPYLEITSTTTIFFLQHIPSRRLTVLTHLLTRRLTHLPETKNTHKWAFGYTLWKAETIIAKAEYRPFRGRIVSTTRDLLWAYCGGLKRHTLAFKNPILETIVGQSTHQFRKWIIRASKVSRDD